MFDATMTAAEAARTLSVSVRTVWRWAQDGKLDEAPRRGNYRMFWRDSVERLRAERRGSKPVATLSFSDAYLRLRDAQDWDEIKELTDAMAATICAKAQDKGPVLAAWGAACSMAATSPDAEVRERWLERALTFGSWAGMTDEETEEAVRRKAQRGSFCTYESAKAELKAAPEDPAAEIARAEAASAPVALEYDGRN